MTRRFVLPLAAGVLALAAQETVFRVDVRLVRLLVTVKDTSGNLIGSLTKEQFRVFDNGAEQQIAVFERQTEQPLSVALLIDISGSTAKELPYEIESVDRFLKALIAEGNPRDAASLYTFNHYVVLRSSFTRRLGRLQEAMKDLKAEAGTSLYDALYFASREFRDRECRRILVVVTDGGDTTSGRNFHDALEAAQLADAVIYPILVMPIKAEVGRNIGGENALTMFAQGTGGRVFLPTVGKELDAAFRQILEELRTQYLVAYYPKDVPLTKNRFHRLEVRLDNPNLRPSTRSGYYGEYESTSEPGRPGKGPAPIR